MSNNLSLYDLWQCQECFDTWLVTEQNSPSVCRRVRWDSEHALPNPAALRVRTEANRLFKAGVLLDTQCFNVARLLTCFTAENPMPRRMATDLFWGGTAKDDLKRLREFQAVIATLRSHWLLPVCSSKSGTPGYWIATEQTEYERWFREHASAPITQFSALLRNAKHNYPVFAEQQELEFFGNVEPEVA
jgi:hypothetical protein